MKFSGTYTATETLSWPRDERLLFCKWLEGYGLNPDLTYKVEVGEGHMTVYQFHGDKPHKASQCGGSPDEICKGESFEVAL